MKAAHLETPQNEERLRTRTVQRNNMQRVHTVELPLIVIPIAGNDVMKQQQCHSSSSPDFAN